MISRNTLKPFGEWDIKLKGNYGSLKKKLFLRILFIFASSALIAFILREIMRGKLGNRIVYRIESIFQISNDQAIHFYRYGIRSNIDKFIIIYVLLITFIIFLVLMRWIEGYFLEISEGLKHIAYEKEEPLRLSPEIKFMEDEIRECQLVISQKQYEVELAERRKNDMVMYLAHDIKTPLTSVIGYLSLLDEVKDMPEAQKEKYAHIALDKAYRLEQLIDEFFEITRYNFSTVILEKEQVNLNYMLIQMADEFYPLLKPQEKIIELKMDEELFIYADANKIARVFNNILKNAIAYSYDKSRIQVSAYTKDSHVIVKVVNEGKTIPQEKLEHIFEKFYRLDASRNTIDGGAGLGLAIAKEIVAQHEGQLLAESQAETTTFKIILPHKK